MPIKTSIIIPCYWADQRLIDITQACLNSLQYGRPDEVIVVDDGSPLAWEAQGVEKQIRLAQNAGYPAAVNTGLIEASGRILIIGNNDLVFTPGWLPALLKPLKLGYDISTVRVSDSDGWTTEDKITEGDKFGSLWAMKRKVYTKLGGFDERFGRGTFEDLDYRRRAIEAGFRIGKNHHGLVEHLGRATFDRIDPEHRLFLQNRAKFQEKYGFIE